MAKNTKVEKIYSLSPMQEGMLYHSITDKESEAYFEQSSFDIEGDIDIKIFEDSINELIKRYDILRTIFIYEGLSKPQQVVLRERKAKVYFEDISTMEEKAKVEYVEKFKKEDRKKGFNVSKDLLMRTSVLKLSDLLYKVIWSFHHILMDGWCIGIVLKDFLFIYQALLENITNGLGSVEPYSKYIKWLEKQDTAKSMSYWKEYLEGYEQKALIPCNKTVEKAYDGHDELSFTIDLNTSEKLVKLAKEFGITLNCLMQTVWGILLGRYNNVDDVVFGAVTSGRPYEVEGIETMIGLFINNIPVRIKFEEHSTFSDVAKKVHQSSIISERNSYIQLAQIQSESLLKQDLIDNIYIFENYPVPKEFKQSEEADKDSVKIANMDVFEQTNYDFSITLGHVDEIVIKLNYNTGIYNREFVQNIEGHFMKIIKLVIKNRDIQINKIDILTDNEKKVLINEFNNTNKEYQKEDTLVSIFEKQVKISPHRKAVIFEDEHLTYLELNQKANQLAKKLKQIGVEKGSIVGIMLERSLEMMIGIMGILKAGGVYLPIDPYFPDERKRFILGDSGLKILITYSKYESLEVEESILLDSIDILEEDGSNIEPILDPSDTAYIIYTSGSTGNPKGTMIRHYSVINRLNWMQRKYPIDSDDVILQKTPFTFDVSVWELFWWFFNGASVCFLNPGGEKEPETIVNTIYEKAITTMHFVPSMLNAFLEHIEGPTKLDRLSTLRQVFTSGEALKPAQVKTFNSLLLKANNTKLINLYGPTEATVDVTYYNCSNEEHPNVVPIGKPIDNTQIYIVDKYLNLQPIEVPGELCISGDGLAKGYLGRPELTAEKFITCPFDQTKLMYRTGDIARWMWDGNIEYLGRMDFQVKIRGNRVELGEIEAKLVKYNLIREAVVCAIREKEDIYLCAYYVSDGEIENKKMREFLQKELPSYMIPQYFVHIEKVPVTSNGKVDRKMLPKPGALRANEYIAPRNDMEKMLCDIWGRVLGRESIGIKDNFFEIGGDSIKAIQISSQIYKEGYKLEIRDLMENPRIIDLSNKVLKKEKEISQAEVEGEVVLSPIQKSFFDKYDVYRNHYNQAFMVYSASGFDENTIRKVFNKIVIHHDALRMVYKINEDNVTQYNKGINELLYSLDIFDLTMDNDYEKSIEREANIIQEGIDLEEGPLLKLALFKAKEGHYLLMVIHHLVVDGVSWRILFEDISQAYTQVLKGEEIKLQSKTCSYKEWTKSLTKYSNSSKLLNEIDYWRNIEETNVMPLPRDKELDSGKVIDSTSLSIVLDNEETEKLIQNVNYAYNTEINDILIAALGLAIKEWCKNDKILISLEGHGREEIVEGINITRTVGWFTSEFPVLIDISSENLSDQIIAVKETLRSIPDKGIGYGILKYMTKEENKKSVEFKVLPEICFNYLGQVESGFESGDLELSDLPIGNSRNPESKRSFVLDINCMVVDKCFTFSINYNKNCFEEENINKLLSLYKRKLSDIVAHCSTLKCSVSTPSDFTYKKLSIMDLNKIYGKMLEIDSFKEGKSNIKDIYPLTPMQEGMLFHSIFENNKEVYFEQTSFSIETDAHVDLFKKSFDVLCERYDTLRTVFVFDSVDRPLQVVLENISSNFHFKDISAMDEKSEYVEKFTLEDRKKSFEITKEIPVRLSVLYMGNQNYKLIWSFHHILMDGWCVGIITNEFFHIYNSLRNEFPVMLENPVPYSKYISWLLKQDIIEAEEFWKKHLEDFSGNGSVPKKNKTEIHEDYLPGKKDFTIDSSTKNRIDTFTAKNSVTMNTFMQTIWGVLLSKYNNSNDVVFGAVTSGRPAEVLGIESMVGLFINTIPVRIKYAQDTTFTELMKGAQKASILSDKYNYIQLAKIQSFTIQKQNLINNIVIFENFPVQKQLEDSSDDSLFSLSDVDVFERTNYDLNLTVIPQEDILFSISYNKNIYDNKIIERIEEHFKNIIDEVLKNPDSIVNKISLLCDKEKNILLNDFNNTKAEYPKDDTLVSIFEKQVEKTPDKIAVQFRDEKLTYFDLNSKANALCEKLTKMGVEKGTIVGIMLERSLEMIIGIIGILKAGGAYLPIDPHYPKERKKFILSDSEVKVLVTVSAYTDFEVEQKVLVDNKDIFEDKVSNPQYILQPSDLAYIIYTSGSTGKPKGTMIEHRSVVNRLNWMQKKYPIGVEDVILQKTPFTFDVSVWELFWWSFNGARVCFLPPGDEKEPEAIVNAIVDNKITTMHFVPSMLNAFLEYIEDLDDIKKLSTLKRVFASGEALNHIQVKRFNKILLKANGTKLSNLYGPTEATVDVTYFDCFNDEEIEVIPIGKPIDNTKIYIVDHNFNMQPIEVSGELCISGVGLSRGYLNRLELTNEKFIQSPFDDSLMYRTGDIAKWTWDGNIEYLGRMDFQVKIRGNRVELGEIEAKLLDFDFIKEAVVCAVEENGDMTLCAYYVSDIEIEYAKISGFLHKELPSYMVPQYFMHLEKMPVTSNGKVDRNRLPKPQIIKSGHTNHLPVGDTQIKLVELWEQVLGVLNIGTKDNFFELGGHSLKAISIMRNIHKLFDVKVPLSYIFENPTIEELSKYIESAEKDRYSSIKPVEYVDGYEKGYFPLSSAQKRIYVVSQKEGAATNYNMIGAIVVNGKVVREKIEATFQKLIDRHESLRTSFELKDSEAVQYIYDDIKFNLDYDEPGYDLTEDYDKANAYIEEFIRPFDLKEAPLIRAKLVKLKEDKYVLCFDMHHIISDGISTDILMSEFIDIYEGEDLPMLNLQYKDFAFWHNNLLKSDVYTKQQKYWLDKFSEIYELNIPTDFERPKVQSFEGSTVKFSISEQLSSEIRSIAEKTGSTLFMTILAIYNVLLSKYSRQKDIVIGTPVAGRPHEDLKRIIGMFVNTLALKNTVNINESFIEFLKNVRENTLQAFDNQDFQFEELVKKLGIKTGITKNALFNTLFTLQTISRNDIVIAGEVKISAFEFENKITKFDFMLTAYESEKEIMFALEYCTQLFRKQTMEKMAEHFVEIVRQISENPDIKIIDIDLVSNNELEKKNKSSYSSKEIPIKKQIETEFDF